MDRLTESGAHYDDQYAVALQEIEDKLERGEMVELPAAVGTTVYTITRDDCPCEVCGRGEKVNYNAITCLQMFGVGGCPNPTFAVESHIIKGYEIGEAREPIKLSEAGEWGYEGLEHFYSDYGHYLTREEAEVVKAALEKEPRA